MTPPLLFSLPRSHRVEVGSNGLFRLRCRSCGEVSVSGSSDASLSFSRFAVFCSEHVCPGSSDV